MVWLLKKKKKQRKRAHQTFLKTWRFVHVLVWGWGMGGDRTNRFVSIRPSSVFDTEGVLVWACLDSSLLHQYNMSVISCDHCEICAYRSKLKLRCQQSVFLSRAPGRIYFLVSTREEISYSPQYSWASLVAQLVKNLPVMWETCVWSLGWEDPLEKGKATHSSILA